MPRTIQTGRDFLKGTAAGIGAVALASLPGVNVRAEAPEQAWDLPTTLAYLSQKAGLSPDAWRDGATFETFQAEVFHE